jgi:hypothetical protein
VRRGGDGLGGILNRIWYILRRIVQISCLSIMKARLSQEKKRFRAERADPKTS